MPARLKKERQKYIVKRIFIYKRNELVMLFTNKVMLCTRQECYKVDDWRCTPSRMVGLDIEFLRLSKGCKASLLILDEPSR